MLNFSFLKKEIKEIIKTHKIIVLPAILLFFGLTSPMIAKFMNKILEPALKKQGMLNIGPLPEPKLIDSYMQFSNNFIQIGLIAVVLVFMGIVVDEKVRGSAILVLTKSVSRTQFIISKFAASVLLFTVSYLVSVTAFSYYSYILFSKFLMNNTFLNFLSLWLLGVFIISVTIFASTISKSHILSAVIGFLGYALTMALTAIPYVKEFSPGFLGGLSLELLNGTKTAGDFIAPAVSTAVLSILFLTGSIIVFKRQEL
jgi:ABC-2 type transport system permease protein